MSKSRRMTRVVYTALMFNVRTPVVGALVVGSLGIAGCQKSSTAPPPSAPAEADGDADEASDEPVASIPDSAITPTKTTPKIHVELWLEGIADMMEAARVISTNIDPDQTIDAKSQLQATLLALGFAPAFLDNIELDGRHSFAVGIPEDGGSGPADFDLAASVAVVDARRVLDGMPPSFHPEPLGEGIWELLKDDLTMMFKEAPGELLFGLGSADLERSGTLRAAWVDGRRVRVHATDLDELDLDPSSFLPRELRGPLAGPPSDVLAQLDAVDVELEFGTDRGADLVGRVHGPFAKLGLEPIGAPRSTPTDLEARLPDHPFLATTMAWGDPAQLQATIDRSIPLDMIPEPFGGIAKTAIDGLHVLIDQLEEDIVMGVYAAPKGRGALAIAAGVKDPAAAMDGVRRIREALVKTLGEHAIMQGENEDLKFKIEDRAEATALPGVKADRTTITIAKAFRSDLEPIDMFLAGDVLEMTTFASGSTIVMLLGAGASTLAPDLARHLGQPRTESLAGDPGLASIRAVMQGCQFCSTFDPSGYLRFRLDALMERAVRTKDRARRKEVKAQISALEKSAPIGTIGLGMTVTDDHAVAALTIPESTMFAPRETIATYDALTDFLSASSDEAD